MSAFVQSSDRTYFAVQYGVLPDGSDHSLALQALVNSMTLGGEVRFALGTTRLDTAISVPYTAPSPSTAVPNGFAFKFSGYGAYSSGRTGSWNPQGGTILDLRSSAATGKIDCRGAGTLELTGITFSSANASASGPFVYTTNTTVWAHHCSFIGRTASSFQNCDEDAFVFGGIDANTPYNDRSDAPFQGYVCTVTNCGFARIRRAVYGRAYFNAGIVRDNWFNNECGGIAPFELNGFGFPCAGNLFEGNQIQLDHYTYVFKLTGGSQNQFIANSYYDATITSVFNMDSASLLNLVIDGFDDDTTPFATGNAAAIASTTRITSHAAIPSVYPQPISWPSNTVGAYKFANASGIGPTIKDNVNTNSWYQQAFNGANAKLTQIWIDSSAATHYMASISHEASGTVALKFEDDASINSDIIAPVHLRLYCNSAGRTLQLGASDELVSIQTTKPIGIKSGSNTATGTVTLNGNTEVTVTNTSVKTGDKIVFASGPQAVADLAKFGEVVVTALTDSTSFKVASTNANDNRVMQWWIMRPS